MSCDSLYLYGIADGDADEVREAIAEAGSVTPAPPEVRRAGRWLILVSPHDGSEILQTRRRMLAHTRVLERAMTRATVLPMRFGHVAEGAAALAGQLAAHDDRIAARISALRGRAEFGLRVSVPREPVLAAILDDDPRLAAQRDRLVGRGHAAHYEKIELGRRVAEALERRRTDAQHRLAAELSGLCESHVLKAPEEDVELLRAECLVPADRAGAVAARVEAAASALGLAGAQEVSVRLVGPVPPFHFVELSLAPEAAGGADRAGAG